MTDNKSDSDSNYTNEVPVEILEKAKMISMDSLPKKSKLEYIKEYNKFKAWRKTKHALSFAEDLLIVYFNEISENISSATLWAKYSKLRLTIKKFDGVDIGNYKKLIGILKHRHANYIPKKSSIFTTENISKFCNDAPNNQYLDIKVVLAIGVMGACRTCELVSLKYSNIEDHNTMLLVKLPGTKTPIERSFTIHGELYKICKTYMNLRPKNLPVDRFFLNFQVGKCTRQPIGKHKIAKMPTIIADFLQLPNPQSFTGHAFRRTSANLLVDGGGNILDLKRLGAWQSDKVAEGYIGNSVRKKRKIAEQIVNDLNLNPSTSADIFTTVSTAKQNTFDVPPLSKKQNQSTVSIMETTDEVPSTVQNKRLSSLLDFKNSLASANAEKHTITHQNFILPENFFDDKIMGSHSVNVHTKSNYKNKYPIFQFSSCNVTINMLQEKNTK